MYAWLATRVAGMRPSSQTNASEQSAAAQHHRRTGGQRPRCRQRHGSSEHGSQGPRRASGQNYGARKQPELLLIVLQQQQDDPAETRHDCGEQGPTQGLPAENEHLAGHGNNGQSRLQHRGNAGRHGNRLVGGRHAYDPP